MAGYSARQSSFTTGDTITAAHSNNEFNAILAAFHVSTGHTHDGTTAGDGGPLSTLYSNAISMGTGADTDIAVTFNANSNDGVITWMEDEDYFQFSDDILLSTTEKVQFRDTAIYINSSTDGQLDLVADTEIQIAATTIDMNGAVDVSGTLSFGSLSDGSVTITDIADEDNMSSNSATKLATQQSIKAYVDSQVTAQDLDFQGDSGGALSIDLDSESLTIAGGTGVTTTGSSNTVTVAVDAAQTGITSLLATDIKIGEDDQTKIDFETANEIHFYANNTEQVYLADNIFGPQSDSDVDLGTTGVRWKDAYIDTITTTGNVTVGGDLTISGDDLTMATNTAGNLLIADGTNYNPTAVSSLSEISTVAGGDLLLAVDASGGGLKKITRSTLVAGLSAGTEISNLVEDTTPQLGGNLDSQGNSITDVGILGSSYGPTGTPTVVTVTVASKTTAHPYYGDGSSSGYFLDGAESPAIDLHGADSVTSSSGYYYKFDQADSSNSGHPLRFYLDAAKTIAYTTGVTTSGTPGTAGAHTTIAVTDQTPSTLYYQCSSHAYMGNYAGLNSAYIASSSAVTIDAVGDITLDADGGDIVFKDAGTTFGSATNTSGNLIIKSGTTTALTFDGANVAVAGDLTVNGTTTTVNSTTVTIDDPIFTLGGDSAPGSDDNKDRGIEFRYHNGTAAKVGFFGWDDSATAFTFIADATNSSEVFSGTVGNVAFGNIAGTLTTAAQTNITSVGALDGGSITSGFGTIDTGSSNITTTGLISGGSLDIDNVLINGTTIGHTDDTDLMTLASGALTVAGTIEGTTITASTALVPDASGGADLGSTSLEWGDLYIADDKKIYLGSDQNLSIEYDEDGNDTTAVVAAGGVSMAPHGSSAGNGTELRFQELAANGANYVGFKAPDSIAANKVFVLPNADGTSGQFLTTDGSTNLSWGDAGGGGSANFTANGSITAGKAVILQRDGKVAQVTGTSGTAVAFNTDYTYNEKFDNGNIGANSFYSYTNILNKHTGMYFFIDRQLNSYYAEPYGTTAGTGASTYNQMIAYSIDADGNFTLSDIVEPHANSIWGTAMMAIPGTDIQVLSTMDNNSGDYNYFLRAFTYRDGEFTFGTAAQVTTHNAYDPHSSASLVWDVSADAGVFTHQDYHTSDYQKVKSRVFTVDENTLAITLGSEQDVGTTTGEIGYTGAGNRNSTVVGLVYDEDNEFVVHVRSYRKGKGTEDVDAYAGEVTGGTTRSISWGSKQTIFADGTGTNSYDRPFHAIYDKTSNRLVVAVLDTNGDSGDHGNWTSDILNITVGSDKSMTVNGNTNYISGTHSGNGGIRPHIEYIDDISKYMIFYNKIGNSGYLTYRTFTTSGTSFTFDTEVQVTSGTTYNRQTYPFYGSYGINYDSINKNWSFLGKLNLGGRHATYAGLRGSVAVTASNLHEGRLLGLAAATVSDGASVEITHTGGSNTNSTGLYKGIDVIVNKTGDIHQRVAGSGVLGKYAAVVGRALTATTVAVNTSATTTGGGTQGPNYLELGAGDQLPRLDGGKLYGINDNFLPLWKNIYNDRWKWSAGATSHAISIPLDYYKGSNPFMYKLVAIIQDVGDAQNTYHMRLNDVSTSVYADGAWFTRAGYDSGSQTPGAYNSYGNNQSEFRNVAAQLNTVTSTSERMFSYLEFTVVRRMMFDTPAELTTARDAGYQITSGGIWDSMVVENQGMRWRPCWWKSYNIEGETTSNAAGTNGRITDIHGSGLWYPSTTAHTELTSLNLISGTSENFQIKYALFVNSVDSGWARVNYTDINSNT